MTMFREKLKRDGGFRSSIPERATGGNITGGSHGPSQGFDFTEPKKLVRLVKSADCDAHLHISINRVTVDLDDWNDDMSEIERRLTIYDVMVSHLEIMSDVDVVYGTDLIADGWA